MDSYNLSTVFSACTEAVECYIMSLRSSEDNSCAYEPWICVHGCYTQIIQARHKTAIKIYHFSEAIACSTEFLYYLLNSQAKIIFHYFIKIF
jgi:hypothetical protein